MMREAHLAELLDSYAPHTDDERRAIARMQRLLETGAAAFDRHSYVPGHFTASALVRSPRGDEVLLIHHSKLGLWLQPGGHIEESDGNVLAAARRELIEESGVVEPRPLQSGLLDIDIHHIPESKRGPTHEHFDLRFAFEVPERELRAGSDATAARWSRFEDVTPLDSDLSVLRAVAKLARLSR